jgi:hypothetical protein
MSESADYTRTSWVATHDYSAARSTYTTSVVNRSYSRATATRVAARDLVKTGIKIDTPTLIVVSDVTGSMGQWPAVMFGKLPYLMHELKVYLGEDARLLIAAVGDAVSDDYPLQIHEPKSTFDEAKETLEALVVEGNGGGTKKESYELAAGYFLNAVDVARNIKPILVFIGDESPYPKLTGSQLAALGVTNVSDMDTTELFSKLNEIYDVHLIHKPYSNYDSSPVTEQVKASWLPLLPPQHIHPLREPERVVDTLFGILAGSTEKVEEFTRELLARQTPAQVKTVLTTLNGYFKTVTTNSPRALRSGKSTMHKLGPGKPSRPLL